MASESEIERLIGPAVEAMGFRVVRVKMLARPGRTLQVMAERGDGTAVGLDDCAAISHTVGALLDVEDPVPGAYRLEVSSTGIDRPLVRPEDFDRFAGFEAVARVEPPLDGRRRFRGRLQGMAQGHVRLALEGGRIARLPFEAIVESKLVATDALLQEATAGQGPGGEKRGE